MRMLESSNSSVWEASWSYGKLIAHARVIPFRRNGARSAQNLLADKANGGNVGIRYLVKLTLK